PDLRTARRLAGPRHRQAILLAPCDPTVVPAATVLRSNLARIRIAVHIVVSDACDQGTVGAEVRRADLVIGSNLTGSSPPNRDPAQYFEQVLDHGGYQGTPLEPG